MGQVEEAFTILELIMDNAYLGDFFDGIPAIISQACWHIHDADFEARRLGDALYLLNYLVSPRESRLQSIDYMLYIFVRKIPGLGNNSSSTRNRILSNKTSFGAKNNLQGVRGTHNCVVVEHTRVHVLQRFSADQRNR